MYAGLPSRLEDDMKQQYIDLLMQNQTKQEALEKLKKYKINIIASPSRKYTVFEGGAVYADIAKVRARAASNLVATLPSQLTRFSWPSGFAR
eukprot:SAG31_NODE_1612_length_7743_cov_6.653323_6_plen_92_part_00